MEKCKTPNQLRRSSPGETSKGDTQEPRGRAVTVGGDEGKRRRSEIFLMTKKKNVEPKKRGGGGLFTARGARSVAEKKACSP